MKIRIGTRKSRLALIQTNMFISAVNKVFPDIDTEIVDIVTKGDEITDIPLDKIGGKGFFTDAIENALLENRIDFAVHSAKDMPSEETDGLCVSAVLERASVNDVLIFRKGFSANGRIKIGTSSRRRTVGILKIYPDAEISDIRGNVDTRLNKLANGEYDGIILAAAGLERLGAFNDTRFDFITIDTATIIPAPCQGIIAVQSRQGDYKEILDAIKHSDTYCCFQTEREILRLSDSGCSTPVGAVSYVSDGKIYISATADQKNIICDSGDVSERFLIAERIVKQICPERFIL